jgi:Flp pilus assembly protein TadD
MSLLLQALQKASKTRGGEGEGSAPDPLDSDELSLEPLGSSEPAPREAAVPAAVAAPAATPAQAAAVMQASRAPAFDPFDYAREHYMIVFIACALLVAIGYGTYVYIQVANPAWLRPKPAPVPALPVAAAPPPAAPVATDASGAKISGMPAGMDAPAGAAPTPPPAAVAASAPTPPTPAAAPAVVAAAASTDVQGGAQAAAPADPVTAAPAVPRAEPPAAERKPVRAAAAPRPRREVPPTVTRLDDDGVETVVIQPARRDPAREEAPAPQADVMQAYQALQAGDLARARVLYAEVLKNDPNSIDALLGLGAIAWKEGRADEAGVHYQRVLELEPRNTYAQAGLISIIGGADPQASETRLRTLIAREPSAFLYFTLGNLYADQGQWPGAQQAYFQAYQMQSDNPDYAFNLAVGLEHLGQTRSALDYYRKALDLSFRKGRANFDQSLVIQRVGQLSSRVEQ